MTAEILDLCPACGRSATAEALVQKLIAERDEARADQKSTHDLAVTKVEDLKRYLKAAQDDFDALRTQFEVMRAEMQTILSILVHPGPATEIVIEFALRGTVKRIQTILAGGTPT